MGSTTHTGVHTELATHETALAKVEGDVQSAQALMTQYFDELQEYYRETRRLDTEEREKLDALFDEENNDRDLEGEIDAKADEEKSLAEKLLEIDGEAVRVIEALEAQGGDVE